MQMEPIIAERASLPLPAAAVVIDIRGISNDEVIDWLTIEITDLASEMRIYDIHHWRYLTEFLHFTRITPSQRQAPPPEAQEEQEQQGPMGRVDLAGASFAFMYEEEEESAAAGNMPASLFEQRIDELALQIDRVRNNRIAAVTDLNKAGIPGQSSRDATVRVIFLTDAHRPDSLYSAALYADALKTRYRKFQRPGHQELINTTVLCMGNSGEAGPPATLINNLIRDNSWKHLDALILSEEYRDDAALIAGTTQAYLAELLLYVLLIIPPFTISAPAVDLNPQNHNNGNGNGVVAQQLSLPLNTYVIGLAAQEYSARWGRRWLNFGLAREAIQLLRQKPVDANKEKERMKAITDSWFRDWRARVQTTIPDNIPGDVPSLEGVRHAQEASSKQKRPRFSNRESLFQLTKITLRDLEDFRSELASTYTDGNQSMQESASHCTVEVMQALREHEHKGIAEREITDLGKLQVEAEQILGSSRFFLGTAGAIPRARTQLWTLASGISRFQQEHQNNAINPLSGKDDLKRRREDFTKHGDKLIGDLKKHMDNYPLLANILDGWGKIVLGVLTLLLIMFITVVIMTMGLAWFHHLLVLNLANAASIDTPIFGVPIYAYISTIVVVILLVGEGLTLSSKLISRENSAWKIELAFCLFMLVFFLLVWPVVASLQGLVHDAVSLVYLSWLSFMPLVGYIAGGLLAIVLLIEIVWSGIWARHIFQERQRIVNELSRQQQRDVKAVTDFIADDIILELLLRAELTDGHGGLGAYYHRVDRLCELLDVVADKTYRQQQLSAHRLLMGQEEMPNGGGTWLNLDIRDETLEKEVLTDGYKGFRQKLLSENEDLHELTEFTLRLIGIEKPEEIEREFEEKSFKGNAERRRLQLMTNSLAAITMRFAIDPLSVRNISTETERYKSMSTYASQQLPALPALMKTLNKRASNTMLQTMATPQQDANTMESDLVTDALAIWSQLFWQHQDSQLDTALTQDSILAQFVRLLQQDYDARAIMRKLLARTVLFGRSLTASNVDLFLLLAPSQRSHQFLQGLKGMKMPRPIGFPDAERILLLAVKHYKAEPLQLPPPPPPSAQEPLEEQEAQAQAKPTIPLGESDIDALAVDQELTDIQDAHDEHFPTSNGSVY